MKIAIITFEFNYNYGAILQATALSQILADLGHEPTIINRSWGITPHKNCLNISNLASRSIGRFYSLRDIQQFKRTHWKLSHRVETDNEIAAELSHYDVVITGSDQIWNSACIPTMGLYYFGIHSNKSQRLISYAASFGHNRFETDVDTFEILKKHLHRFKAISVREKDGVDLLRDKFGIESSLVLDPTMLLTKDYYLNILGKDIDPKTKIPYLAYYLLDPSPEKMAVINQLASDKRLSVVTMNKTPSEGKTGLAKIKALKYPSVESWLRKIIGAQYVITDSFHGTVFSILFNKQFAVFSNTKRGNSRFDNLLGMFNLQDRMIEASYESDKLLFKIQSLPEIDYSRLNQRLNEYRKLSLRFITDALS